MRFATADLAEVSIPANLNSYPIPKNVPDEEASTLDRPSGIAHALNSQFSCLSLFLFYM